MLWVSRLMKFTHCSPNHCQWKSMTSTNHSQSEREQTHKTSSFEIKHVDGKSWTGFQMNIRFIGALLYGAFTPASFSCVESHYSWFLVRFVWVGEKAEITKADQTSVPSPSWRGDRFLTNPGAVQPFVVSSVGGVSEYRSYFSPFIDDSALCEPDLTVDLI